MTRRTLGEHAACRLVFAPFIPTHATRPHGEGGGRGAFSPPTSCKWMRGGLSEEKQNRRNDERDDVSLGQCAGVGGRGACEARVARNPRKPWVSASKIPL